MDDLRKNIAKALIDEGIKDFELAKRVGVSRSMIYRFINGKQKTLKSEVVDKIKKELKMKGGGSEVTQEFAWRLINEYKKDLENTQKKLFECERDLETARKEIERLKLSDQPQSKKA